MPGNAQAQEDQPDVPETQPRRRAPCRGGQRVAEATDQRRQGQRFSKNLPVQVLYAEGKPVEVELPASVSLKVTESAEGLRGDTASNVTKPATLETGKTINVPLFIKEGETIKIDTRTGAYMGRA